MQQVPREFHVRFALDGIGAGGIRVETFNRVHRLNFQIYKPVRIGLRFNQIVEFFFRKPGFPHQIL